MALFKVDFQGTIYGIETFQHGHQVSSAGSAVDVAEDAAAQWLAILAVTNFSRNWRTDVTWSQVNVSELGATPADPVVTSAQVAIGDSGTAAGSGLPLQCAPCGSLRSTTAGSRGRGRMFLPPPAVAVIGNNGRLTSTATGDMADGLQDYLTAMETATHTVGIVSSVGGIYQFYNISTVRVGDVIDTQRRRRNGVAEVYAIRDV